MLIVMFILTCICVMNIFLIVITQHLTLYNIRKLTLIMLRLFGVLHWYIHI